MTNPTNQQCGKPGCNGPATHQYRQQATNGTTTAYFACNTHQYPDQTPAQTGLHTTTCGLYPCTCTPTPPVSPPVGDNPTPPAGHNTNQAK